MLTQKELRRLLDECDGPTNVTTGIAGICQPEGSKFSEPGVSKRNKAKIVLGILKRKKKKND